MSTFAFEANDSEGISRFLTASSNKFEENERLILSALLNRFEDLNEFYNETWSNLRLVLENEISLNSVSTVFSNPSPLF